jgi:hypothetical protein
MRSPARALSDGLDGRARIGESEKVHNRLDEFEHLLLRFIAFGHVRRQPLAAGPKQSFKCLADWSIGLKVSGNQPNSSMISIRCRLVIAANGIAHTFEQGVQEKPISRGHTENPARLRVTKTIFVALGFHQAAAIRAPILSRNDSSWDCPFSC